MKNNNIIVKLCLAFLVILGYFILVYKLGVFDFIKESVRSSTPSPDGTYKSVTVDKLFEDLESNALIAEDEYKGKYVAVTGRLSIIETDYISLMKFNNEILCFDSVNCYFTKDEQKNVIKEMNKGDIVTIKGKIKKISKTVSCYYLNITEIPEKS